MRKERKPEVAREVVEVPVYFCGRAQLIADAEREANRRKQVWSEFVCSLLEQAITSGGTRKNSGKPGVD